MYRSTRTPHSWLVIIGIAACAFTAKAQSPDNLLPSLEPSTTVAPYVLFDYAAITGSGNTITASYIPEILSNGTVVYKNVTMQFAVDPNTGVLTMAAGYPKVILAPVLEVSSFQSGTYIGPSSDSGFTITVAGPGGTSAGATEWTVSTPSTAAGCTYPGSGTWYVGPISTSPIAARLKAAGITSTAWSYGIAGSGCTNGYKWNSNDLIGVSQVGNTITFVSFTYNGTDQGTPTDQITYTMTK